MWGRGRRGNIAACCVLIPVSITSLAFHKWFVPFRCWFAGGWVCVHSRTLWVSPEYCPVRLGVSPTTAIPTYLFLKLWFWVLSCPCWNPGFWGPSCSLAFPQACLRRNVGLPVQSSSCSLATSFLPHCLSPALLSLVECFFSSLVVGLLCKCFSGSFGGSLLLSWLFSLFWLCKEVKRFCLCLHLGPPGFR